MSLLELLPRVVADRRLHARLLNTLSRMEYVGARKILKSRRSEHLDAEGLQHVVEEVGHALRLKRAAERLAETPGVVATYDDAHTLAGSVGEDYVQGVDAAAAEALADLAEPLRTEVNYLLSSVAIEVRAESFYAAYDGILKDADAPFRVASIYRDEVRHLAEMQARLDELFPVWRARLAPVTAREEELFAAWLRAVADALGGDEGAEAPSPVGADAASR